MGKSWGKTATKINPSSLPLIIPKLNLSYPQLIHKKNDFFSGIKRKLSTTSSNDLLLLLILLLFPANLAKRFILPSSYVLGVLIDYLTPALYLTELLVLLLLVITILKKHQEKIKVNKLWLCLVVLFLISLVPSILISTNKLIAVLRFLELALWLGFSLWITSHLPWKRHRWFFRILGWGVGWVSLLALGQFLLQRSLLGYWFLGEPVLTPSLGGVAQGSFFGREVLRAYGTFPHPNVLGGILSVILVGLFSLKLWWPFAAGLGAVFVSLSRTAWLALAGGILGFASFGRGLGLVILNDPSVSRRWELWQSAWEMFRSAPLAGVGLGQFVSQLPQFGLPSGLVLFLQPVHNIFALVAAESGVFPLLVLVAIFFFALRETILKKRTILTIALLQLVFLGMFDHYLYTLPQGLFLFSLILGWTFSYAEN